MKVLYEDSDFLVIDKPSGIFVHPAEKTKEKTILDLLRNRFYYDDSQVKTLLAGKKIEARVPQNFAYIAVKKLSATQDVDALKISGLERSITMFQELKSKKVL